MPASALPRVGVVVPCRNEIGYIGRCLASLAATTYPHDRLDVVVVDGGSTDGTTAVVGEFAGRVPFIRLLSNPAGITPAGMNIGVRAVRGEFVFIMGAHNEYDPAFIGRAIAYHEAHEADCVGGVLRTVPRTSTPFGRATAAVTSHPFGVGGSRFRVPPAQPVWADAAFGACYRRAVFERIGLFNEFLVRGQDMEFNLRLARRGGRTLVAPDLMSVYHARSRLGAFIRHNWRNGLWAILPFHLSPIRPVAWRHLVPLAFVLGLGMLAAAAPWSAAARWGLLLTLGSYGLAGALAAGQIAWRARSVVTWPMGLLAFWALHLPYGLGGLWGVVRILVARLRGERRPTPAEAWPALSAGARP